MSNVWENFEQIKVKTITWEEVTKKTLSAKDKQLWIRAVKQGLQDCMPMGDCPFYGRIPTHVLIKCRKGKENGTTSSNSGRRNNRKQHLRCKQECIQCKTSK